MAADDSLGIQFHYYAPGENDPGSLFAVQTHRVAATIKAPFDVGQGRNTIKPAGTRMRAGELNWKSPGGKITGVDVSHIFQRKGIATAMLGEAQRIAATNSKIPKPKHSEDRTREGDKWAKAVGGRLPKLKKDYG